MRCVAAFRNFRNSSIINARLRYDDQRLHNQRVMEIIAPGYSTRDSFNPHPLLKSLHVLLGLSPV